jgi:O-acetylhomoserine (thiol)-lyase
MRGASGLLAFGLKAKAGGSDAAMAAGMRFFESAQFMSHLVNIGDTRTLISHPASTTHRQLGPEDLVRAGVSEDMVRLSVGIEHVEDLKEDLEQALAAV